MGPQLPFEFEYGGQTFRVGVLDLISAGHIARRLQPLLIPFAKVYLATKRAQGEAADAIAAGAGVDQVAAMVKPTQAVGILGMVLDNFGEISKLLADMPDDHFEAVLSRCLGAVERQSGNAWQGVWNSAAKTVQFAELNDPGFAIAAIKAVIQSRLLSFFPGGLSA